MVTTALVEDHEGPLEDARRPIISHRARTNHHHAALQREDDSGAAASGTPWQHDDLAPGYYTYSFFVQCPHRMACARCDIYVPKHSKRDDVQEELCCPLIRLFGNYLRRNARDC